MMLALTLLLTAPPVLSQSRIDLLVAREQARESVAAVTPLKVMAADPAFRGRLILDHYPVIAPVMSQQPLAALGAIRATFEKSERILPLSVVAPPGSAIKAVPLDPAGLAYCDGKQNRFQSIRCYQDRDGDGRLETVRWGLVTMDKNPLTLYALSKPELIAPIPYVPADVTLLPAYSLIYQGCQAADRIQYASRIGVAGDGDIKTYGCTDTAIPVGHSAAPGPGRYRVDRMLIEVAPGEGREAAVTLIDPLPTGALLDRIDPGKPVRLLGEREGWPIEQARMDRLYKRPAFLFAQPPRLASSGLAGTEIVGGPFRYGYPGSTAKAVALANGKPAFAAGEAVYGVPMRTSVAPQVFGEPLMVWCAPREFKPEDWRATCVQQQGITRGFASKLRGGLMIDSLGLSLNAGEIVDVVQGEADLPAATISHQFASWSKNRLFLRSLVGVAGQAPDTRYVELPRFEDGSALLAIGGGVVRVTQTPDGGFATELLRPFEPGGDAQPRTGLIMLVLDAGFIGGKPPSYAERIELLDDHVVDGTMEGP